MNSVAKANVASWRNALTEARRRRPYRLSRLLPPHLVVLPGWCPGRFGAWAYGPVVLIGPAMLAAPADVRCYVTGHEYGHIFHGHTGLHALYLAGVVALGIAFGLNMPTLGLVACSVTAASALPKFIPSWNRHLEFQADAMAMDLHGPAVAYRGAHWMAEKTGTSCDESRVIRLDRLRFAQPSEEGAPARPALTVRRSRSSRGKRSAQKR